ncbi:MAG TPA: metallopeptidase family protein [Gemmatimonadales bacterium]|nr:metallopeptidase family protein [Gemmatimonadales bacterium]
MTLEEFRTLVGRLQREIPAQFESGVADIEVSPKTVPHPVRQDVYTLGECVPLSWSGNGADLHSKIVLYYGSFHALARQGPGFDWRAEAWDTLTHELRHHLEFRAHVAQLEAYDWAAEQNFARQEGQVFDPVFYRSGERVAEGIYKVDDDVFLEIQGKVTGGVSFVWHGRAYRAVIQGIEPPAFLTLDGLADEPHGDAVLVLHKEFSLRDLWRRAAINQRTVVVEPIDG